MVLHRLLRHAQALADLPVGQAVADEIEDLALGVGQLGGRVVVVGAPAGDGALVQEHAPGGDGAHDVADLGAVDGLEQVGAGPGLQGLRQGLVVVEGGQDDRQGAGDGLAHLVHELDAGAVGQLEVDEDDVGAHELGPAQGLRLTAGLGDDLEAIGPIDDLSDAAANDLVIVDDHDPDGLGGGGAGHAPEPSSDGDLRHKFGAVCVSSPPLRRSALRRGSSSPRPPPRTVPATAPLGLCRRQGPRRIRAAVRAPFSRSTARAASRARRR